MNRKALFRKWNKNPEHDYNMSDTLAAHDDTGRDPDICFVYSGRNRSKSFEVSANLLADAWYDHRLFGYIRRYDCTIEEVEQYFDDKHDFIRDMTDGARDGITKDKGRLKFYKNEYNEKSGEVKRVKYEDAGYFFALSRQASYKSLQYPDTYNMLFEEVLTDGQYLSSSEPEKLMNLYSTVKRHKEGFKLWLISNTVSVVNPYSSAWGIQLSRNKPGDIRLSKLYLKSLDKNGEEEYLLIAAHYLEDKGTITKEQEKEKKNRIKTGISSNAWDELRLYPTIPIRLMRAYKPLETVIFEYDDMMMQADLLEIPVNLMSEYVSVEDEDEMQLSDEKMPILYIRRKTSEPKPGTRVYTNNGSRLNPYTTQGIKKIYAVDEAVAAIIERGWTMGADNLTMNDFYAMYDNLWSEF